MVHQVEALPEVGEKQSDGIMTTVQGSKNMMEKVHQSMEIIGRSTLDYDELSAVLIEIEGVINT